MNDLVAWLREQIAQLQRAALIVKNRPVQIAVRRRPGTPPLTQEDRADLAAQWKANRREENRQRDPDKAQLDDLADPDTVLGQLQAYTAILDYHAPVVALTGLPAGHELCSGCSMQMPGTDKWIDISPSPCRHVRMLAPVFRHRDGYRPEWEWTWPAPSSDVWDGQDATDISFHTGEGHAER